MSLVPYKQAKVDAPKDEKEEEIDWISNLPDELLMKIVGYLPPQYYYSLHLWIDAEKAQLMRTSRHLRDRERRNRWSFVSKTENFLRMGGGSYDVLPLPGYFNYKNLLHLNSMLLKGHCLTTNKLRMFHGRLFLSGVHFIHELSTTKRERDEEYGQRFEDSEDPSDVENLLRIDAISCQSAIIYTVADDGSVYFYEDVSREIRKFDGKVQTTVYPPIISGDDVLLSMMAVGSNLCVARTNGFIDIWQNDQHVRSFDISLSVKNMCVHKDMMYVITDGGECLMSNLITRKVTPVDLNSLADYYDRELPFDMCVRGNDHMYLYYEYHERGRWIAGIFHKNISTTYIESRAFLEFNKYNPTDFTPNMHVSGHYLCVTTSQNTLVIVDLRDFSLKTIEEPLFYSAVLGDDFSLYANCGEGDSSKVIKFYW